MKNELSISEKKHASLNCVFLIYASISFYRCYVMRTDEWKGINNRLKWVKLCLGGERKKSNFLFLMNLVSHRFTFSKTVWIKSCTLIRFVYFAYQKNDKCLSFEWQSHIDMDKYQTSYSRSYFWDKSTKINIISRRNKLSLYI
jgi:hypothetical protein